ncbi:MAG TPA: RHS repeat-associated core domain-containing protein, partial [Thermoanaerobaculia bacterium]|nr:RHS repeat-associated core domain-containing protein [Thermoanaerobaculia bacterium]
TWVDERSEKQRTPWQFSGKEMDEETGLNYFGFRYYDARQSQWINPDPILDELLDTKKLARSDLSDGAFYLPGHVYGYVANSPTNLVDPNGLLRMAANYVQAAGVPLPRRPARNFILRAQHRERFIQNWMLAHDGHVNRYGVAILRGRNARINRAAAIDLGRWAVMRKNIASAELELDNQPGVVQRFFAVSGYSRRLPGVPLRPGNRRQFQPNVQDGASHSEVKLFEHVAAGLQPGSGGRLRIYSPRPVCRSCLGVVQQFNQRFPNISVEVWER